MFPAHLADPIRAIGDSRQCVVHFGELVDDLIVNRDVGKSFDCNARAFTDSFAEGDTTTGHVCTRAKRRSTAVEIIA